MKEIFAILFIFSFGFLLAQKNELIATEKSKQKIDMDTYIGFDGIGNIYYIKNNVLFKNDHGTIWEFKNLALGKITNIDIQNPLKIVCFYENFNMAVLLDNRLTIIQSVLFSKNSTPLVINALGLASQNRLWIYNSLSQQIGLYDLSKNTFEGITIPFNGSLKYYEADYNYFQWIDEKNNWYSCDVYGKVSFIGEIPEFDQIQMVNYHTIIFLKEGNLFVFDFEKKITYSITNVEKSFKKFYYKDRILSIFTSEGITNYNITIPK
ncbi:MAG TPA: hypothetical protein VN192_04435 [Flavobacterium sp.]|nr:hypothetical protein [Flavobacterium sp.]